MINKTTFLSIVEAEAVHHTDQANKRILISLTGPTGMASTMGFMCKSRLADLHEDAWKAVLRLQFHDVTISKNSLDNAYVLFDEQMALQIFRFLKEHEESVEQAIVHCEGGVSRSAAVSKFIAQIYSCDFPEGYQAYNRHVFQELYKAYGRCAYGEGEIKPTELPGAYYKMFTEAKGEAL